MRKNKARKYNSAIK